MRTTLCTSILIASTVTFPTLRALDAQTRPPEPPNPRAPTEIRVERMPGGMSVFMGSSNRAMLGVTLSSSEADETTGVRVDEVRADGPAAKAGVKVGDVITAINGVSLALSPDDAADPALAGIAQRRLQRTLAKAKPGDDVTLRVASGGTTRTITVKTVSAADLSEVQERRVGQNGRWGASDRPAIGLTLGASGSVRDTLGLFIASVVAKGPAELAGIVEGERVAAVNGVDVRVPREDVEDRSATEARINRFLREVQKGDAGGTVTLRVHGAGRYRDVAVKSVRQSELPTTGVEIRIGERLFDERRLDGPRVEGRRVPPPSSVPTPPVAPLFRFEGGNGRIRIDGESVTIDREVIRDAMEEMRRGVQEMGREMQRDFRFQMRDGDGEVLFRAPRPAPTVRRTVTIL